MKQRIFITGGTSGIGFATALLFGTRGFDVCLTGLDQKEVNDALSKLSNACNGAIFTGFVIDLSLPGFLNKIEEELSRLRFDPDVVMHNAGFGTWGPLMKTDSSREDKMIHLLVISTYHSTRYFLEKMLQRGKGTVINISSISAFQPSPGLTTYGACKAFVYQFSRAISMELKQQQSQVRCMVVCPTPVRTGFQKAAGMEKSSLFDSWMTVTPEMVAEHIFKAYCRRQDFLIPGIHFSILSSLVRRLPESWQMRLAMHHLKPKDG
jgi:short-subunit dehydrogenase